MTRSARDRLKKFAKGQRKFKASLKPTTEQLLAATERECRQQSNQSGKPEIDACAAEIYHAGQDEERIVQEILS